MSEATEADQGAARTPRKKATSLSTMLLADLKALAGGLGIQGVGGMKKAQLVQAIKAYQDQHSQAPRASAPQAEKQVGEREPAAASPSAVEAPAPAAESRDDAPAERRGRNRQRQRAQDADAPRGVEVEQDGSGDDTDGGARQGGRQGRGQQNRQQGDKQSGKQDGQKQNDKQNDRQNEKAADKQTGKQDGQKQDGQKQNQKKQNQGGQNGQQNQGGQNGQQNQGGQNAQHANQGGQNPSQRDQSGTDLDDDDDDGEGGGRRNRRRRGRERNATRPGRGEPDTTILEDDVLVPAAGILDVLDNYAFVRTSGYLPGPDDVYLSLSMVRKYGLRRGDAVVGQVRQPREGERKEKFNPMVRVDQVNGSDPEAAKERPEFDAFVPVHPSERLRLETGPDNLLGRIVDVFAPIGKGQRGMVLSPPRSGKTQVLQTIAAAIRHNNPECHVMVVLVDERPEEVTDYQRTIRGEVVASTFDRPAADHVLLAELAVERAKRLVELGHDVVLLLDSLTRLARAFNVAAPGSGRQGHGGVDAVALHPAKRLFGAARNVEDGGSLTILATALVESGSPLDEAVLDEFNDTANMELRLRRELIERRIFPPVDVVDSGTRREEHLLSEAEQQVTFRLRSAFSDLEPRDALSRVLARMAKSSGNDDFLAQAQKASDAELSGS